MLKKTITYTDYNGNERTEDFFFNLSKAEVVEMELGVSGGLTQMVQRIVAAQDGTQIIKTFKEIVLKAYGEISPDGKRFVKSDELSTAFSQTEAYSNLFMELATNHDAAAAFINAIVPQEEGSTEAEASPVTEQKQPMGNVTRLPGTAE